jgi:hypothetical protein
MRGDGAGRLRWLGKPSMLQEAFPRWVGAPGPAEEERWRLVSSGDGEASGADKMHREDPFYRCVGGEWMGWTGRLGLGS